MGAAAGGARGGAGLRRQPPRRHPALTDPTKNCRGSPNGTPMARRAPPLPGRELPRARPPLLSPRQPRARRSRPGGWGEPTPRSALTFLRASPPRPNARPHPTCGACAASARSHARSWVSAAAVGGEGETPPQLHCACARRGRLGNGTPCRQGVRAATAGCHVGDFVRVA